MTMVEVVDVAGFLNSDEEARLAELLRAAIAHTGGDSGCGVGGEVRVRLVRDAEMSAAHLRYSGIAGTTDVLTFDMRDEVVDAGDLDVDLWVCVDEATRQGEERGIDVMRELLLYCLHGVLHCLGYDDHDEAEFERMHAEEDRILDAIGVGRTFRPAAHMGSMTGSKGGPG